MAKKAKLNTPIVEMCKEVHKGFTLPHPQSLCAAMTKEQADAMGKQTPVEGMKLTATNMVSGEKTEISFDGTKNGPQAIADAKAAKKAAKDTTVAADGTPVTKLVATKSGGKQVKPTQAEADGAAKKVAQLEDCPDCDGFGGEELEKCETCGGTGKVEKEALPETAPAIFQKSAEKEVIKAYVEALTPAARQQLFEKAQAWLKQQTEAPDAAYVARWVSARIARMTSPLLPSGQRVLLAYAVGEVAKQEIAKQSAPSGQPLN